MSMPEFCHLVLALAVDLKFRMPGPAAYSRVDQVVTRSTAVSRLLPPAAASPVRWPVRDPASR